MFGLVDSSDTFESQGFAVARLSTFAAVTSAPNAPPEADAFLESSTLPAAISNLMQVPVGGRERIPTLAPRPSSTAPSTGARQSEPAPPVQPTGPWSPRS
eukprot:m.362526 g.362526  ORF g.362526 m.362526 type:complete len:100 (+) comp16650_c1_seq1:156-455(+)